MEIKFNKVAFKSHPDADGNGCESEYCLTDGTMGYWIANYMFDGKNGWWHDEYGHKIIGVERWIELSKLNDEP